MKKSIFIIEDQLPTSSIKDKKGKDLNLMVDLGHLSPLRNLASTKDVLAQVDRVDWQTPEKS